MDNSSNSQIPTHPKLRPVEPQWIDYQGQKLLLLRDPMGLAQESILIPQSLVPFVALCDGTRDLSQIRAAVMIRTGMDITLAGVADFVAQLDAALLLENGEFQRVTARILEDYRAASYRTPSHAGLVYPENPVSLREAFDAFCKKAPQNGARASLPTGRLAGMVCPHIDYARGHLTYAALWQRAAPLLENIELAIIFGTDHMGGLGMLTPTRQSYATPLGVLPTEREVVDGLAEALGPEKAFAEELHHLKEHSIELASVWLQHFLRGRRVPVVPVLCGSFHHFVTGEGSPEADPTLTDALDFLRQVVASRRTLVIAAGDLAHVGPAFGDRGSLDAVQRAKLKADDAESIDAICRGDAGAFFTRSRQEANARRICGLSPIYMTLACLDGVRGESLGYDQCPADNQGGSVVSIAGVLLYEGQ
ncbi:MAG: AmmeMemoRadiSam system protein B [Chloroflexi bacterium]|nr:AmmeMemoRadiSam system protein B [Chloroflexota bacterium]